MIINLIQEDDIFNFVDLSDFAPGKPLTVEVVHADGSVDTIKCNHTYNEQQIDWYRAGSALNMIKGTKRLIGVFFNIKIEETTRERW